MNSREMDKLEQFQLGQFRLESTTLPRETQNVFPCLVSRRWTTTIRLQPIGESTCTKQKLVGTRV